MNILYVVLGASVLGLAIQRVKPRAPDAFKYFLVAGIALCLMGARELPFIGGLLERLGWPLFPLEAIVAAAGLFLGLLNLADTVFPVVGGALPPAVENQRRLGGNLNLIALGFWGLWPVLGVLASLGHQPIVTLAAQLLAVLAGLAAFVPLQRRGLLALWVLERRPHLISWVFPNQLTVINRRYGTRTVHWSATLGLVTGEKVALPASDENHARELTASAAYLCPNAERGYSPEAAARFSSDPASLKKP